MKVIQFSINVKAIDKFFDDNEIFTYEQMYFNAIIGKSVRKTNAKRLKPSQFKKYLNCESKLLNNKFDDIIGFDGFALWYNNNFIQLSVLLDEMPTTYKKMDFNEQLIMI